MLITIIILSILLVVFVAHKVIKTMIAKKAEQELDEEERKSDEIIHQATDPLSESMGEYLGIDPKCFRQ